MKILLKLKPFDLKKILKQLKPEQIKIDKRTGLYHMYVDQIKLICPVDRIRPNCDFDEAFIGEY